MNVHTIPKRIFYTTDLMGFLFSYFESIKSFGGWNVIIKVWNAKIFSNFKRK